MPSLEYRFEVYRRKNRERERERERRKKLYKECKKLLKMIRGKAGERRNGNKLKTERGKIWQ